MGRLNGCRAALVGPALLSLARRVLAVRHQLVHTNSEERRYGSPRLRVALGDTRDVVIIQGHATICGPADVSDEEIAKYQTKHGSNPRHWADSFIQVRPLRISAWQEANEIAGRLLMTAGRWLG